MPPRRTRGARLCALLAIALLIAIRDIGRAGTGIPDRSLTVKFSYMFDLLR